MARVLIVNYRANRGAWSEKMFPGTETVNLEGRPEDYEELPEGSPAWVSLSAGALAGIAEHTITYPFDSIKTRMQVLRPHPKAIYRGTIDALRTVVSSGEGLGRLWSGVTSVVVGAGPAHAIYFGVYEEAKKRLVEPGQVGNSPIATGVAGGLATAVADAVMTPFDVVKQRMQVHESAHRSVVACAKHLFRHEGIQAFYASYPTTLLLNVPFHMVQFPTYEFFRKRLLNSDGKYDPTSHVVAGAFAGGLAAAVTTPIDVIKTTLQTRGIADANDPLAKVRGMSGAIRAVYRERGLAGFSRGIIPRVLTHMPATAICWTIYEYIKWVLI